MLSCNFNHMAGLDLGGIDRQNFRIDDRKGAGRNLLLSNPNLHGASLRLRWHFDFHDVPFPPLNQGRHSGEGNAIGLGRCETAESFADDGHRRAGNGGPRLQLHSRGDGISYANDSRGPQEGGYNGDNPMLHRKTILDYRERKEERAMGGKRKPSMRVSTHKG